MSRGGREWYRCPACGYFYAVTRPRGRRRPKGHVKTMWCPVCACVRGFVKAGR